MVVVASKPCLEMSEVAWLEQLINDAKKGGIRIMANESTALENITNWDIQSTIFLALQVMGSVGESHRASPILTFCGHLSIVQARSNKALYGEVSKVA